MRNRKVRYADGGGDVGDVGVVVVGGVVGVVGKTKRGHRRYLNTLPPRLRWV